MRDLTPRPPLHTMERGCKTFIALCVVLLALMCSQSPVAAQEGCEAAVVNDQMDGLIASYLTERTQDSLGAAQTLQEGIAVLIASCQAVPTVGATTPVRPQGAVTPTATRTPVAPTLVAAATAQGAVIPAGEAGDTGQGFSVQVTGLVRPANDVIASQSPFNPAPGAGEEYVVVVVIVACPTTCDVDYFDFALTGDSGVVYSGARVYYEGRLNVRGAGGSGDLPFLIRADETNLRLLYLADRLNDVVVTYEVGEPRGTVTARNPAVTSTPEGGIEVIANTNLNVREGPGTQYRIAASVPAQTALVAYGRSEDSTWLRVVQGWVFADLVKAEGDVDELPVVEE